MRDPGTRSIVFGPFVPTAHKSPKSTHEPWPWKYSAMNSGALTAKPSGTICRLFCGDGGDEGQVAHAKNGRWIYLFRPELFPNRGIDDKTFVKPGVLRAEKLVNMAKHQYRLEPNVSFTPDQKWVVFRSNMFGPTYTFAVEVARTSGL